MNIKDHLQWIGIGALLLVIAVFLFFKYGSGDERIIREQFARIEEIAIKTGAEQPFESLAKSREIADFFQDSCLFAIESARYAGTLKRRELIYRINGVRNLYAHGDLKFYDIAIDIHKDQDTAAVTFTMRIQGQLSNGNFRDVRDVESTMHKVDGVWLFTSIYATEVLRR